jgi:hypothetical protein
MKSVIVCLAALAATVTSVDAHQAKKKVVAVAESVCHDSSKSMKTIDCKVTGTVGAASPNQLPTLKEKPRLGYSGDPWIFSGF